MNKKIPTGTRVLYTSPLNRGAWKGTVLKVQDAKGAKRYYSVALDGMRDGYTNAYLVDESELIVLE